VDLCRRERLRETAWFGRRMFGKPL